MSFEIRAEGIDAERLRAAIENRLEERRRSGLYTDEEIRFIAERALEGVLSGRDARSDLQDEFRARDAQWQLLLRPRRATARAGVSPGVPSRRCGGSCGRCRSCSGTRTR